MKCRSIQLCSPVKITPPSGYNPVTVTVVKSKFPLASFLLIIDYYSTPKGVGGGGGVNELHLRVQGPSHSTPACSKAS